MPGMEYILCFHKCSKYLEPYNLNPIKMKKLIIPLLTAILLFIGCGVFRPVVRPTYPYNTTLVIPATSRNILTGSVSSDPISFEEIFGNRNGRNDVRDIKINSARLIASAPNDLNLSILRSVRLFITDGRDRGILIASRNDISSFSGSNIILDINTSRSIDNDLRGNNLRLRLEYVLKDNLRRDVSVRSSIVFSTAERD